MTSNVGGIDRIVRIVAGIILIALVFVGPQTPWCWLGIVPLATGLLGWCRSFRNLELPAQDLSGALATAASVGQKSRRGSKTETRSSFFRYAVRRAVLLTAGWPVWSIA
jgi:membrane protein implicated in regulation of membrane protease activity